MCEMIERSCPVCFIRYSIPLDLFNGKGEWTCPNGHGLVRSSKKTEVDDLKAEITRINNQVDIWKRAAEHQGKRVRELESLVAVKVGTRVEIKRLKKKINAYKSTLKRMKKYYENNN